MANNRPRCDANGCNEPKFYVNGSYCLTHIKRPPKSSKSTRPAPADESESSD